MTEGNLTLEEIITLRAFKRSMFDLYWEKFGVFYLHVMPHPQLEIGKRGLVNAEKEHGIVLVFGDKAVRDIDSKENYLYAELQFGSKWESTIVPWDAVSRIFDKFQNSVTQIRFLQTDEAPKDKSDFATDSKKKTTTEASSGSGDNVIRIDFGGKPAK